MVSKIFLDVNILLDLTLRRDDVEITEDFFREIIGGNINAYTSPSVLHIVSYWTTKAYGSDKTKIILLKLLADITVVHATHKTALMAINSKMKDIEDALQYYTALHHNMDVFISRDAGLKKEAISSLPVYSVKEFLSL